MFGARRSVFLVLLGLLFLSGRAQAGYSGLIVFGDSLSDTGNCKAMNILGWLVPASPFYNYDGGGRFTCSASSKPPSGKPYTGVWHEVLTTDLGIPPATPSHLFGTNFAFADAEASSIVHFSYFEDVIPDAIIEDILTQIGYFSAESLIVDYSDYAYVFWAGGDNVMDTLADPSVADSDKPQAIRDAASRALQSATTEIEELAALGATTIIWCNLPPLGSTPRASQFWGPEQQLIFQAIGEATNIFNGSMDDAIRSLTSEFHETGLTIYKVDVEQLFNNIWNDGAYGGGARYGITNVVGQAKNLDPTAVGVGDMVDKYLFWDEVHPTSHAHAILGDAVYVQLKGLVSGCSPGPTGTALPNTTVQVFFKRDMNFRTLGQANVTLAGSSSGPHTWQPLESPYWATTLVMKPDVAFSYGETVTVTVKTSAYDAMGNGLTNDWTSTFTIGAAPTFTVTCTAGGCGSVSPSGSIQVPAGGSQAFHATPNSGYAVDTWYVGTGTADRRQRLHAFKCTVIGVCVCNVPTGNRRAAKRCFACGWHLHDRHPDVDHLDFNGQRRAADQSRTSVQRRLYFLTLPGRPE